MTQRRAVPSSLKIRACDACGSVHSEVILGGLSHKYILGGDSLTWKYQLVQCCDCGLGYVDPIPDSGIIQTFYEEDYGCYVPSSTPLSEEAHFNKYRLARMRYARLGRDQPHAWLQEAFGKIAEIATGRTLSFSLGVPLQLDTDEWILELGYGSGDWLINMAALGYKNLHGYDIDANQNRKEFLQHAGITTWSGSFLMEQFPAGAFSCIRLEHVFEHLSDPITVLKKCKSMLRHDGLMVLNLPCNGSWSEMISLIDHPALELPRHLYRHSPTSVRKMLEHAGFEVRGLRVYAVASHLEWVINACLRRRHHRELPTALVSIIRPMYSLASSIARRGEHMTILAVPRSKDDGLD